ncbi:hypothetical protein NS228_06280 [Methylobacterium indicum]|uniref:hypothetical protein n=1 Tax=Methylobacterium indicum TaxID=1775910 RepID=UPI0007345994|nr:hypothetical protein [Methylobacterium indicum]KTS30848.1 hypothetical protein NS229_14550 [Methylobacterium indicum]KTS41564.1 hypothetical protein NS228_06280 [Methylobacterium indicum]KTS45179.1 hypothetical protein NS230_24270 [Methylobacterium indicum]
MLNITEPAPIGAAPTSAVPVSITIVAGGTTVFHLDEGGGMLAPESATDRMAVLVVLSHAISTLAAHPIEDDPAERPARLVAALHAVGSPAALEAIEDLRETTADHTDAMRAAGEIIAAALPSTH